jgi:16S rRNA (guanine966-N2)-methyltransferase
MRVVSGVLKGRGLKAVPGNSTRPTTDKVKEAIFNMIGPYFNGGIGLDLFAGSGGLGIEGLSRGLEKVIFVDLDRKAIQTIKENLRDCQLEDHAEVYRNEASRALKAVSKRDISFNYIFLDPPYKKQQLIKLMEMMDTANLLRDNGVIVCEHGSETQLPTKIGRFEQMRHEEYGIIGVTVYTYNMNNEGEN